MRASLAPQHRVRRPRRGGTELLGRDATDATAHAALLEDRLGKVSPRAVAVRRDVIDAVRLFQHATRRFGEMPDIGRRPELVVDDRDLVPLGAEPQHRPDEVVSGPAEEPGGANDPAVSDLLLSLELRAAVDA